MFVRYWSGGARSIEGQGWGEGRRSRLPKLGLMVLVLDNDSSHGCSVAGGCHLDVDVNSSDAAVELRRNLKAPFCYHSVHKCRVE